MKSSLKAAGAKSKTVWIQRLECKWVGYSHCSNEISVKIHPE